MSVVAESVGVRLAVGLHPLVRSQLSALKLGLGPAIGRRSATERGGPTDYTQQYDDAGNLTIVFSEDLGSTYNYQYDHNNRLTAVYDSGGSNLSAAFEYDALGRRIEFINEKLDTTTRYYYDGCVRPPILARPLGRLGAGRNDLAS